MPAENKRTMQERSPSKSPSSNSPPPKSSKMELSGVTEGQELGVSSRVEPVPGSSPDQMTDPLPHPAPPSISAAHIEEIVQSELGKHSQLDDQSRLIISLTVSIIAKINSNQTSLCPSASSPNLVALEQSVAQLSSGQNSLESQLSELSTKFENRFSQYDDDISKLKKHIGELEKTVSCLKQSNSSLQYSIDEVDQYERRDSLVFSGKCIPREVDNENTTDIILQVLRNTLFMDDLRKSDINVCHRLGGKRRDRKGNLIERPIICKFISRSVKREIKQTCLDLKPDLYANESLTNLRRDIFTKLRFVRKAYKFDSNVHIFTQLYTNDGKIMIKLQNNQKFMVTNPNNLYVFLNEFPEIKARYESINFTRQQSWVTKP